MSDSQRICPSSPFSAEHPSRLMFWEHTLEKLGPKEMENRGKVSTFGGLHCNLHCYGPFYILALLIPLPPSVCSRPCSWIWSVHTRPQLSEYYMKHYGKDPATEMGAPGECLCSPNHRTSALRMERRGQWYWHLFHAYYAPFQGWPHCTKLSHLVIDGHYNAPPLGPTGLTGSFPQPWVGCWQKAEERGFCPQPHSPSRGWSTSNDQVTLRHKSSAPCPSSGQPWRTSPASELPGSGEAFVEASS